MFKLPIIPPWVKLSVAAAIVAATFAAGVRVGSDHQLAKAAKLDVVIKRVADEVEARTADRIADIRVTHQTINAKTREVVYENTVYRDCVLDDATRRLLDDAREGVAPAAGSGVLP